MSVRPAPIELLPWALASLGWAGSGPAPGLSMVAGDASPRRYFRLVLGERSYVLAEAPPTTEKNEAFLRVATLLAETGIKVPAVLDADLQRGFLLLEDLGDRVLLPALDGASAHAHYQHAFAVLAKMSEIETQEAGLGNYDEPLLGEELGRFGEWFVQRLLGHETGARDQAILDALFARLIDSALEQPRVLVHRDFHSRNLMLMHDGDLAVIDFQDAVVGPITYDLVSLLRDCYIRWPVAQVDAWALDYCAQLRVAGLLQGVDDDRVLRWFDWMGLQRHLKVLGTFARLSLRDGKAAYLEDLPRVLQYVQEILEKYAPTDAAFADFLTWFEHNLSPLISRQPWSRRV